MENEGYQDDHAKDMNPQYEAMEPDNEDEEISDVSSNLQKDDSGITLEAPLSCKSDACGEDSLSCALSSPADISIQNTSPDVTMGYDAAESLIDSAIPSSSVSESSADVKSEANVVKDLKDDEDECSLDSHICPRNEFCVEEHNSKELPVNVKDEGKSVDKTTETGVEVDMDSVAAGNVDTVLSVSTSDEDENSNSEQKAEARAYYRKRYLNFRRKARERQGTDNQVSDSLSSLFCVDESNEGGDDEDEEEIDTTDSATDSDRAEFDNEISKTTSDIVNKIPPPPNWYALPELRRREYGYSVRQSSSSFNEKVQGSIHMVRRLKVVDSLEYHEGCVNSLCFNRIGTLLASGSDDLNIVLWNWQRGCPSLVYGSGHRSNVFQAKFMPYSGDCHVVSCARDGQVRVAELSLTGVCRATRKLVQHKGAAHKLALEYDTPNMFLSCGEDAVTYLLDLRDGRPHRLVTTKENEKKVPLYSIHSNPSNPQQFCVGGRDHFIRVYDKRKIAEDVDGGVLKKLCPDHLVNSPLKADVTCACYNYNGTEILGSYNDEDIYLFDNSHSDGANFTHRYQGHRNSQTVKGVNFFGPKSEFVVSGSDCGNLFIWEKESEAVITFQEGDNTGVINVLEPHPSLPVLATSGLDHDVKLWMPSNTCDPKLNIASLQKTIKTNLQERKAEMDSEPSPMSGHMLWLLMHHFRNTARRQLREEGQELSTSDDDNDDSESEDSEATVNQCTQS